MADPTPLDPDRQLEELCRVLNYYGVGYVIFGSHVARLNGVPLETVDVDVVPARQADNLDRLAEALNLLRPRWRVEGIPEGLKIDGGLEARHFSGDSAAIGLVTRLGPVDVVLEPKGYKAGYAALVGRSGHASVNAREHSYLSVRATFLNGRPTSPPVNVRAVAAGSKRSQVLAQEGRRRQSPDHRHPHRDPPDVGDR